jgi:hypothetical protein
MEAVTTMPSLCPRSVAQDGNEFYVLASIIIFGVHDRHQEIRRRLWDGFARSVWGLALDDLLPKGTDPGPLPERARTSPYYSIWQGFIVPRTVKYEVNLAKVRTLLLDYIRRHATTGTSAPLELACPLLSAIYGLGVVLYDAGQPDGDDPTMWHPRQTWEPPDDTLPPIRYLHLMQRRGTLQMLVDANALPNRDIRTLIPTRVVGPLPLRLKTDALFEPATSDLVLLHAVYTLDVFDSQERTHSTIGPFVAPATRSYHKIQTLHYMRLDTRMRKAHYIFTIEGCQQAAVPLYIFACTTRAGERTACCIGHWLVDLHSPRISLHDQDDALLIVPGARNADAAARCVMLEWGCSVSNGRP